LENNILADLNEKMVFLGGPRQVGKTTFSKSLLKSKNKDCPAYLSWDDTKDRQTIQNANWPKSEPLIIFDEIHKFARWRNLVKGFFDKLKDVHQFLVTGSARLDYYRKGGDSLLGRYHYYRMHPLTLPEIIENGFADSTKNLLNYGGFPEPFLKKSDNHLRRWHRQRRERIVYTDIRDLENVKEISNIELLINHLPERVGSILSRKNLSQDMEVDFKTIEKWITILENVYYCYRVQAYGPPKLRAAKKEQKIYFWDWSEIENAGSKWENFIGSHLLKYCHYIEDTEGHKMELRFIRDNNLREIDFVVLKNKKPIFAVECKSGEKSVSKHLQYFADRTDIPKFYQVHNGNKSYAVSNKISVMSLSDFCKEVGLK
jgi:predicted AAA+ superfamily ATPase